jgi:hypothetical protein
MGGAGQILDAEGLSEQDTIERGEAEPAATVEEVGNVRLSEAGLARKEHAGQNTQIDSPPYLKPQALV